MEKKDLWETASTIKRSTSVSDYSVQIMVDEGNCIMVIKVLISHNYTATQTSFPAPAAAYGEKGD